MEDFKIKYYKFDKISKHFVHCYGQSVQVGLYQVVVVMMTAIDGNFWRDISHSSILDFGSRFEQNFYFILNLSLTFTKHNVSSEGNYAVLI